MAALHDALKFLGPCDYSETPVDDLQTFLPQHFSNGQIIVDSIPLAAPPNGLPTPETRSRSNTATSAASSASEIALSSARSSPPPPEVEALQKEWKQVKLGAKENPLGMSVYKMAGKDGRGSWFARRSVHEGLGFAKWKKALEREFPETMKVQGGPGEGNIRGIGGETRVAYKNLEGVGKMEVYLLSAQFPGPTAPRDFVTMFLTSDQALSDPNGGEVPRHFMVISKPCTHPDAPPREGYIRGNYESVEFIREIPINNSPKKSASLTNLGTHGSTRQRSSTLGKEAILRNANRHSPPTGENETLQANGAVSDADVTSEGRARGKTISFDRSRGSEAKGEGMDIPREEDESEMNPVEWIMITRSDPGGSVPRFLIDRGTPGGIVGDATKFLNWACGKDMEDFEDDETLAEDDQEENSPKLPRHDSSLHNFQTNGHLAGLEEESSTVPDEGTPSAEDGISERQEHQDDSKNGIYGLVSGGLGAAGGFIASHAPQAVSDYIPGQSTSPKPNGSLTGTQSTARRGSTSSISTVSSAGSFASALENRTTSMSRGAEDPSGALLQPSGSATSSSKQFPSAQEKELQKLEERKRKLDLKLQTARERELSKKSEDIVKEEEALRKAAERHEREIKKQEERYKKEVEKLRQKKEKEERKAEDRKKKQAEKDERTRLLRELEEVKAEVQLLKKEREILKGQVGELQKENTSFAVAVGRMGEAGEDVLRSVREDMGKKSTGAGAGAGASSAASQGLGLGLGLALGRKRGDSIRNGMKRSDSFRSFTAGLGDKEKEKEKENSAVAAPNVDA